MDNQIIREPQQKRSIEKKNRIIEAGTQLFTEKGYHNTNTAEIAAKAGVDTGTVYSYLIDKKTFLMEVLDFYIESLMQPLYNFSNIETITSEFEKTIEKLIDISVDMHHKDKKLHEELMALSATDKDVGDFFHRFEEDCVIKFAEILKSLGFEIENLNEKIHIAYNMLESYCHEETFHKHRFLNYEVMKKEIVTIISNLFSC